MTLDFEPGFQDRVRFALRVFRWGWGIFSENVLK
jgi:hypothetical protein